MIFFNKIRIILVLHVLIFSTSTAFAQLPGGLPTAAGLTIWLKADGSTATNHNVYNTASNTVPCTDGQPVYHWNNMVVNPVVQLSQATVSQMPTFYNTTAGNLFNFNPVIHTNYTAQQFLRNNSTLGTDVFTALGSTIIFAQHYTDPDGAGVYFKWEDASDGSNRLGFESTGTNNDYVRFDVFDNSDCGATCGPRTNVCSKYKIDDNYRVVTSFYDKNSSSVDIDGRLDTKLTFGSAYNFGTIKLTQTQQLTIGANSSLNPFFSTIDFSEVLIYKTILTTAQINQAESYLGIKYGVSMYHNYIASDGTTITWNILTNATYNNNIFGIARDDNTNLLQKQSHSMTISPATDILTTYIGTKQINNQGNSGTLAAGDKSFFLVGDDSQTITSITTEVPVGGNISNRLKREWLSQQTKFTNTDLSLEFDLSSNPFGPLDPNYTVLLVDDDGNFTNADVLSLSSSPAIGLVISGSTLTITLDAAILKAKPYFTIAQSSVAVPLNWTAQSSVCNNKCTTLNWSVADVYNLNRFEVERSFDGISFQTIANVLPHQASGTDNYSFTDTEQKKYCLYRVKELDYDGKFSYSHIFKAACANHVQPIISISPNPVEDAITISTHYIESDQVQIRVLDYTGRIVRSGIIAANSEATMDISNLTSGLYFIELIADGEPLNHTKIIKK